MRLREGLALPAATFRIYLKVFIPSSSRRSHPPAYLETVLIAVVLFIPVMCLIALLSRLGGN
jgi:hypothetical protein